jgi:hypothetical protein
VELLAEGRTAEVFAWGDGRVLKLDRPAWSGFSTYEATVLAVVADAGLPVPRPYETVTVDDRAGVVLDRIDGPSLADVIESGADVAPLAAEFNALHCSLNQREVAGLPDLVAGLPGGIAASGLAPTLIDELIALLADLDDGRRKLCHFDLHPGNVIVAPDRWVVIDWLTASSGPPDADFARTLLLDPPHSRTARGRFMEIVEREGMQARDIDRSWVDAWIRVVAGARLAEGFDGEYGAHLSAIASGRSD